MRLPERGVGQTRIGVAVRVPEPYAAQLETARRDSGDCFADVIPPHVTLLGPTVVDVTTLDDVHAHLSDVAARSSAFEMLLRGSGTFRPVSPVVFVQVAAGIAECERLERAIRTGPLAQDLRFNYHPHVTVAHEVPDAALDAAFEHMAGFEAAFRVESVDLFEHGDDGVWRTVREFRFGGA